jgi:hypothetical protein
MYVDTSLITCHTGVTRWYANIYNKMIERDECLLQYFEHKIAKHDLYTDMTYYGCT